MKKLYKHAGKCDDQKQFKDILEAAMFYTPEGFTNNSTIYPIISTPVKKLSAGKSLCLFTNILYVKNKLLPVELDLKNQSTRQLNMELHHGHKKKRK